MNKSLEIKDLCESVWTVEKKHALLSFEIDGVPIWQCMRMNLYYEIARMTGVLADAHPEMKDSLGNKIKRYLDGFFFKNPFLDRSVAEVIVIDHVRKVKVDGVYADIYTKYLIDELRGKGIEPTVYEWPEFNCHKTEREPRRQYLDIFHFFFERYSGFIKAELSEAQEKVIALAEKDLNESLGIDLDLKRKTSHQLKNFKAKYWLARRLFQLKKPKRLYVVVSYGIGYMIKAAKDLGIEVIELQHGTFSEYHLGYSYPNGERNLSVFPDQLWVWKDFWKDMCQLPLHEDNVVTYPFTHMEKEMAKFRNNPRDPFQIAVMSQGALGERIADEVIKFYEQLKHCKIIYKLHPSEVKIWRQYPSLVRLSQYPNVTILDSSETPLYKILAESKAVIGVFSTVMYEALEFGCSVYLLQLPGVEYMRKLIEAGHAKYFSENLSDFSDEPDRVPNVLSGLNKRQQL